MTGQDEAEANPPLHRPANLGNLINAGLEVEADTPREARILVAYNTSTSLMY